MYSDGTNRYLVEAHYTTVFILNDNQLIKILDDETA